MEEAPGQEGKIPTSTLSKVVSEGYYETLGITLLEGRTLERRDSDPTQPPVAVVNRAFADLYWPGASPLGKRIRLDAERD